MPPAPKRLTAQPVRPSRYRAGQAPAEESSSSDDEEEDEEAEDAAGEPGLRDEIDNEQRGLSTAMHTIAAMRSVALATMHEDQPSLGNIDLDARFEADRRKEEEERKRDEEEAAQEIIGILQERSEEDSSEYETDSEGEEESEEEAPRMLLKPTFVPKNKRSEVKAEEPDPEATEAKRKALSIALAEEQLKRDAAEAAAALNASEGAEVDDTDDLDPERERAEWKIRELGRIKRDREELIAREKEREEVERRRNMDEEERLSEDTEYVRAQREAKLAQRAEEAGVAGGRFWHKGAYYQDADILKRAAVGPVEDERRNRDALPEYLKRNREAGKKGSTRHSTLKEQDTSKDSLWGGKRGLGGREEGRDVKRARN
ncbi:hypothetical protein SAICODRAFT_24370 [Saitoella complicata NRRL Y-17804]|uniref:uncharacterized protein n=1 Tax=Saitoella complicata (strain BCRC 22490 / CBS 7301 / JCM 7358 / NBRC 10748 / NRRL Y-17804) TaxID=698492 RepID=UPI0008676E7D|nr:uncharacterized protein SAICODRAFT_24370 [Saitoella complicata NRRL Y-17804]ODQ54039.1 hypothetical protein SAICODRAFT_24370 [Saitoella complicata NRRL Y-17804]